MEKNRRSTVRTTSEINARAFAAKEERRRENANYPIEEKLRIVKKLRDATRELRNNSRLVKKGTVKKD